MTKRGSEEGFATPVQRVDTKKVGISKEGDSNLERLELSQSIIYAATGNKLRESSYDSGGSLIYKTVFTYDAAGRLVEETYFSAKGRSDGRTVYGYGADSELSEEVFYSASGGERRKKVYAYDPSGGRTEEEFFSEDIKGGYMIERGTIYNAEGTRSIKSVYDAGEKLKEVLFYSVDNILVNKIAFSYDAEGHMIREGQYPGKRFLDGQEPALLKLGGDTPLSEKVYVYNSERQKIEESLYFGGSLEVKTEFTYDANGTRVEEIRYGADGSLKSRIKFSYEFNPRGDWTKETISKWVGETGEFEPIAVKYRTITYY